MSDHEGKKFDASLNTIASLLYDNPDALSAWFYLCETKYEDGMEYLQSHIEIYADDLMEAVVETLSPTHCRFLAAQMEQSDRVEYLKACLLSRGNGGDHERAA
jgi:hypothetical protein